MTIDIKQLKNINNPHDILFIDPLSRETRRTERNLFITSSVASLYFSYKTQSFPNWLPELPVDVYDGVLTIMVLYLLVRFLVGYISEIQGWYLSKNIILNGDQILKCSELENSYKTLSNAVKRNESMCSDYQIRLNKIREFCCDKNNDDKDLVLKIREELKIVYGPVDMESNLHPDGCISIMAEVMRNEVLQEMKSINKEVNIVRKSADAIKKGSKIALWMLFLRIGFLEGLLPLVLAGVVLYHGFSTVPPLLGTIFRRLVT